MTNTAATYIGGPLDGGTVVRTGGGRWSVYRDDDGQPISARKGDRQWCGFDAMPTSGYTHQHARDGRHVYVHASVISTWQRQLDPEAP